MTSTTAEQTETFVAALFEDDDLIELRLIKPKARPMVRWTRAADIGDHVEWLENANADGYNCYFGANPRSREGSKGEDIALARSMIADFDKIDNIEAIKLAIEDGGIEQPTTIVRTGAGFHAYWRLSEPLTDLESWQRRQRHIIAATKSDPSIHDAPRILRLPGFANCKYGDRPACYIAEVQPANIWPVDEFPEQIVEPTPTASIIGDTTNDDAAKALRCLGYLNDSRAADYESWLRVGMAMHAADPSGDMLAKWDRWSERSDNYQQAECTHKWASFSTERQKTVGLDHLIRWAVQDGMPEDVAEQGIGPTWSTFAEVARDQRCRAGLPFVSSGFDSLDRQLGGGFRAENVHIIAARTGYLKTTLAGNLARRMSLNGTTTLYIKLEERKFDLVWRILAAESRIPTRTLMDARMTDAERVTLRSVWEEKLGELPLRINDDAHYIDNVERVCAEHVKESGAIVILDQISMVQVGHARSQYEKVTEVSNRLRALVRRLEIPLIAIVQVSREGSRKKDGANLDLHDLRDSGALEQDAATVLAINRITEPNDAQLHRAGDRVLHVEILCLKNRFGRISDPETPIRMIWHPKIALIDEDATPCRIVPW